MRYLQSKVPCFRSGALSVLILLWFTWCAYCNPVITKDLSGIWSFTPQGGSQTTIKVPGGGWYKQGFADISEADYLTSITIPSIEGPQITELVFGAVNFQADLYINETFVDSSIQSFTPAAFDISEHVEPGKPCSIRLHVKGGRHFLKNSKSIVPDAAGWSPHTAQGIFGSAKLHVYPGIHISDVFVRTSVQESCFFYDVWIRNGLNREAHVHLSGDLDSWNGDAWNYPSIPTTSTPLVLPPDTVTKVTVGPLNWNIGPSSYWWPNVPYRHGYTARLHVLNLAVASSDGKDLLDQTSVRFGFRELSQASDGANTCYFLNGIRVNFRGDNLAGADYDSIEHDGGRGDAYNTLPGFMPGTNGWAKAVDNYQRLNYNFVRMHQQPATPYMLDVCDEMGLMVMEETAIRGSNDDQDFALGRSNMVSHLKELFLRDRNHPCIVRQSLCNDPDCSPTDSMEFQFDLYTAAMQVDGTRPLSIDSWTNTYEAMKYPNFSVYRHFGEDGLKLGYYTDEVFPRKDRPFGQGAFIGSIDNTRQGFCWFATATQEMRAKGASDIRPYALLEAWSSFVPGVETSQLELEMSRRPLFGEDNLIDPWSEPLIQRVQKAFSPVLVADVEYWQSIKLSNFNGDWPAGVPSLSPNQSVTRTLRIYNDTFQGSEIDVFWELRRDSPTGDVAGSGVVNASVPLGYSITKQIDFTVPVAPNGTLYYLVLFAGKGGQEVFREESEYFLVHQPKVPDTEVRGTVFGSGSLQSCGYATDFDIETYFECTDPDHGYVGVDLGASNAARIAAIVFSPRDGMAESMIGGSFQGSMDGMKYEIIYTVTAPPTAHTVVEVNSYQPYRYLKYVGAEGSHCSIAEMRFYRNNDIALSGTPFGTFPPSESGLEYDKALDGSVETYFDYSRGTGGYVGIDLGEENASRIRYIVYTPRRDLEWRMVGGSFRASIDGVVWRTLHTVNAALSSANNVTLHVNTEVPYRYLLYQGPENSYCNIAEMCFY